MHRLHTIGLATGTAVFLLTASVAFAENRPRMVPPPPEEERTAEMHPRQVVATSTDGRMGEREDRPRVMMASTTRANMQERHEKMREHLDDIKDKKKQEMAQNLSTRFDALNKEWTDRFRGQLDHLGAIVVRIEAHATSSAATAAVQSAKDAIATARTAVTAQAAKTYAVDTSALPTTATSTDSGQEHIMQALRKSFQELHQTLFRDLMALRDGAMKDARKAVKAAAQTVGDGRRDDGSAHATSTRPI